MSKELKPCPFCGTPVVLDDDGDILCQTCLHSVYIRAKEWWQTRPIEDALRAQLAAAIKDADRLAEALKLCQPYTREDVVDLDTGLCLYCGMDLGDDDHTDSCRQLVAYITSKESLAAHNALTLATPSAAASDPEPGPA